MRKRAVRLVLDNPGQHESHWSAILSAFIDALHGWASSPAALDFSVR
ncbi:hypothetical protein [Roseovarius sp. MMSF_3281]|nr:hypothetical protein [Roseovarius sp. MMSF_3281]